MGFFKKVWKGIKKVGKVVTDPGTLWEASLTPALFAPLDDLLKWATPDLDIPEGPNYADQLKSYMSISAPIALALGKVKATGNIIRTSPSGDTRAFIVGICKGEIDSFSGVSINDLGFNKLDGAVAGFHTLSNYTGTLVQTADSRFADNAQAYRGLAYLAFTIDFKKEQEKQFNQISGSPNVTCLLQGLKVPPLAGGANAWSSNPAVSLYYVCTELEGRSPSEMDLSEFVALETFCDAVPTGQSLPRYKFDYIFDTRVSISDIKKQVCKAFHGSTIWSQGKVKPVWEYSKDPIFNFTHNNIVQGSFSWTQPEKFNVIRVAFLNSANDYKKDSIEMRDETSIEINGEILLEDTAYFITDIELARRRLQFLYNRNKYTDYICKLTGFPASSRVELYDVVTVTHTLPGFSGKKFIVKNKDEGEDSLCSFELHAYHSSIYDDRPAEIQEDYSLTLPNPFEIPDSVVGLRLDESSTTGADGQYVPTVIAYFNAPTTPNSIYWDHAEIWTKTSDSGSTWTYYGNSAAGTSYVIEGIRAGFWGYLRGGVTVDVAARSINVAAHGAVAQTVSSSASASENINELPYGYFTVSPTPGLGSFTTVTAALQALPSAGGEIRLLEGTHLLDTGGTSLPNKSVDIRGVNRETVIVKNIAGYHGFIVQDGTNKQYRLNNFYMQSQNVASYSNMISCIGASYGSVSSTIQIDNVRMDLKDKGAPAFQPLNWGGDRGIYVKYNADILDIDRLYINAGQFGVFQQHCLHSKIDNSSVSGTKNYALYSEPITNGTISFNANTIEQYRAIGIYVIAGTASSVVMVNNDIAAHGTCSRPTGITWYALYATGQRGNISFNKINISAVTHNQKSSDTGLLATFVQGGPIKGNTIVAGVSNSLAVYGISSAGSYQNIMGNTISLLNRRDGAASVLAINLNQDYNTIVGNSMRMNNRSLDTGIYLGNTTLGNTGSANTTVNVNDALLDQGTSNSVAEPEDS